MWAYVLDAARLAIAVALLVAGASKLVSPRPLAASLGQVFGWHRPAGVWIARAVAVTELVAAFLLATSWALTLALTLTGLVGAGTAVFAITAVRRGATAPCGCFGESSGRPVGVRNLLAGSGLLAGAIGLLALPGTGAAAELMLPLTAATALLAVMVRDRARLLAPFRRHFTPPPDGPIPTGSEVS
jgi:hypothetical protein